MCGPIRSRCRRGSGGRGSSDIGLHIWSVWFIWLVWSIWLIWFNQINKTNHITVFLRWRTISACCEVIHVW